MKDEKKKKKLLPIKQIFTELLEHKELSVVAILLMFAF